MGNTYFVGDLHLGHAGIITFNDDNGKKIRPFATIEEHDETLINNINSVVKPEDRLYFLGDIVINRRHIAQIGKINGRKKLIKGNHDIFKLSDYTPYFEDVSAYRIYPNSGIICSHIPVHPSQLEHRFVLNVHGHLHHNIITNNTMNYSGEIEVLPDRKYFNICPEHTNYMPVSYDELVSQIERI